MIVVLGGTKGGTNKSTISTNLAVWLKRKGIDVILVDADFRQGTSAKWTQRRSLEDDLPDITCSGQEGDIKKALVDLDSKYEVVLVDSGGHDSKEFRSSLIVADVVITPIRPSIFEIESLGVVAELTEAAKFVNEKLVCKIVLTSCPTHRGVSLTDEAKALVSEMDEFEILNTLIHSRTAYVYAPTFGGGVLEMDSSADKAKEEINSLAMEIFKDVK